METYMMDSRNICIAVTRTSDCRATGKHRELRFVVSALQHSPSTQVAVLLILVCFILLAGFVTGKPQVFLTNASSVDGTSIHICLL